MSCLLALTHTASPKKCVHSFVSFCFAVVILPVLVVSHDVFFLILHQNFTGTGAVVSLPQLNNSDPQNMDRMKLYLTTAILKLFAYFLGFILPYSFCLEKRHHILIGHQPADIMIWYIQLGTSIQNCQIFTYTVGHNGCNISIFVDTGEDTVLHPCYVIHTWNVQI